MKSTPLLPFHADCLSPKANGMDLGKFSPRLPNGSPKSPTGRRFSVGVRSPQRSPKKMQAPQIRVRELIQNLQNQDFSKLNQDPELLDQDLFGSVPKPFTTHESSRIYQSERQHPTVIAESLYSSLQELGERYPGYFASNVIDNVDPLKEELYSWSSVFTDSIKQVSIHNKSLALVFASVHERFLEFFKSMLSQLRIGDERVRETYISLETETKNTVEEPFKGDIEKLKILVEASNITETEKDELSHRIVEIEKFTNNRMAEDTETLHAKHKADELEKRNNELTIANFELSMKTSKYEKEISNLMGVNDALRRSLSDSEQRIRSLTRAKDPTPMSQSMGRVPPEVLSIWTQLSHFCRNIIDGDLARIPLDTYFPKDPTSNFSIPKYSMKRPVAAETGVHYITFFNEIKKEFDEASVFATLDSRLSEFLTKAARLSATNFKAFAKIHSDMVHNSTKKLDQMRKSAVSYSSFLKTYISCDEFLRIPPKGPKLTPIENSIMAVYKYACTHPLQGSVTQTIISEFQGIGNPDLVAFTAQIAKGSKTDPEIDLFRRFLMDDLPFHEFLFYADVKRRFSELGQFDAKGRNAILANLFGPCGWGNIPKSKRTSFDSQYVQSSTKFPAFCLALYNFCVSKIQVQVADIASNDIEYAAQSMLSLSNEELYPVEEYLKTISEDGVPTARELAVLLFNRKVEWPHVLSAFNPEESEFLTWYETFGQKKKKGKGGADRSQSVQREVVKVTPVRRRSVQVKRVSALSSSPK